MGLNVVLKFCASDLCLHLGDPLGLIMSPKSLILLLVATFVSGMFYGMDCMVLFALTLG